MKRKFKEKKTGEKIIKTHAETTGWTLLALELRLDLSEEKKTE